MSKQYWDYFLSIENDLIKCANYVEFEGNNFNTNSMAFTKIIMTTSAEFDTISKEFCENISGNRKADNIYKYAEIIINKYPRIIQMEIILPSYNIFRRPLEKWSINSSPTWWQGYNSIKHDRTLNYRQANLVNAIDAVSSLLILILYYYYEKNSGKIEDIDAFRSPKLIDIPNESTSAIIQEAGYFWGYDLKI